MKVAGFVIHLDRATARRAQAEKLVDILPVPTTILSARDGRTLDPVEKAARYGRHLHRPRYPFALSDGEIACFLSHRAAWQAIVEQDLDAGLIVEDDVAPDEPQFAEVLAFVMERMATADYVRFPRWERGEEAAKEIARSGSLGLVEPFLPMLGMQAQLVGREAAIRLLAASGRFDRPVDSFVQMQWLHGARVLSARPIAIREIHEELGGTVLQNKQMGPREKLRHEIMRPILRLSVRGRNRRWRRQGGGGQ